MQAASRGIARVSHLHLDPRPAPRAVDLAHAEPQVGRGGVGGTGRAWSAGASAPGAAGSGAEHQGEMAALQERGVRHGARAEGRAAERRPLGVGQPRRGARRVDHDRRARRLRDLRVVEQRSGERIVVVAARDRVEPKRRQHVPARQRAEVVAARQPVGRGGVESLRGVHHVLRLPGLAEVVVEIRGLEVHLVVRGVVRTAVVPVPVYRGRIRGHGSVGKELVELGDGRAPPTERRHQTTDILRRKPRVLPRRSLLEAAARTSVERALPRAVVAPGAGDVLSRLDAAAIALGAPQEVARVGLLSQPPGHQPDRAVVERVLQAHGGGERVVAAREVGNEPPVHVGL